MDSFKIGICEPEDFSEKALLLLREIGEVSFFDGNDLEDFFSDKNAVFVRLKYTIDDALVRNANALEYICTPTTGLNHIKLRDSSVEILSLKGESRFLSKIRATPEHVFGLTLALLRNYSHAFLNENNSNFDRNPYRGYELYNNTVGIIGLGRIGEILANYFVAFGAKVYYYDICEKNITNGTKCDSLFELIDKANIVLLEANYTEENRMMIGQEVLSHLAGKFFVNASRGELVDEDSLITMIEQDLFAGVAIDVVADETSAENNIERFISLTKNHNFIITPHIGGATYSSMQRTEEFIARKLWNKRIFD